MPSDPIPPALSASEWRPRPKGQTFVGVEATDNVPCIAPDHDMQLWADGTLTIHNEYVIERRHALAALALHGQKFGFDASDAKLIRDIASLYGSMGRLTMLSAHPDSFAMRAISNYEANAEALARKIEALLPPSESP